jgi:hypothetical protein
MKNSNKLELSKISLGHMANRNSAFIPKKGKGASKKQDRRNWKNEIRKEFA